jgi:hypothetical protein
MSGEDDRRFANNPFARALHPARPRRSLAQRITLFIVMVVGAAIMTAAFVLPLAFAHSLFARHGRWSMWAAGALAVAFYVILALRLLRGRR